MTVPNLRPPVSERTPPRRDIDPLVEAIAQADRIATAVITLAEATCALERLRRGGVLRRAQHRRARGDVWSAWPGLARAVVDDGVARRAAEIGERHGLRGYDAVHLAVAVGVHVEDPVTLASYDGDLVTAARLEGLGIVGG